MEEDAAREKLELLVSKERLKLELEELEATIRDLSTKLDEAKWLRVRKQKLVITNNLALATFEKPNNDNPFTPIGELGFSGRTKNCLLRAKFWDLSLLSKASYPDLFIRGLGRKGFWEVLVLLSEHGVEVEGWKDGNYPTSVED